MYARVRIAILRPMHRLIFVGDVHGCYVSLLSLLISLDAGVKRGARFIFRPNVRVVFLGDLVAKGPGSCAVLDFLSRHRQHCYPLAGNHEKIWVRAKKYAHRFINTWPDLIYFPALDLVAVHAGLDDRLPLLRQHQPFVTGTNTRWWELRISRGLPCRSLRTVVFGHHSSLCRNGLPVKGLNCCCIDTGCVYGRRLTALEVLQREGTPLLGFFWTSQKAAQEDRPKTPVGGRPPQPVHFLNMPEAVSPVSQSQKSVGATIRQCF